MTRYLLVGVLLTLSLPVSLSIDAHEIGHDHEHVEGGWHAKAGFVSENDGEAKLFDTRNKSVEVIIKRAIWLAEQYEIVRTSAQQNRADQARDKYKDALAINSLMASSVGIVGNTYESFTKGVIRNRDAGMTLASATVYAFPASIPAGQTVYDVIQASEAVVQDQALVKVSSTADIRRAKVSGNMAIMYNTQGADYVAEDLSHHAKKSHEQGIRVMNFTYNNNNMLAGGGSPQDMGLTNLGKQWVKAAQSNNILIDVSHSSNQTAIEAAGIATKPIIASHSNAQSVLNVTRNLSDEAMLAIAATGGVVCPNGVGLFLSDEGQATPEQYVEHVIYIANLIGRDSVCFASDFVHNILDFYKRGLANTDVFPPELGFGGPASNLGPEHIWDTAAILEDEHGWSEKEIVGFLGANLMRVYQANWEN
jgi:membrane dipeptidase